MNIAGFRSKVDEAPGLIHPRTVVLNLKTSDFKTMTRILTLAAPPEAWQELAAVALSPRERVEAVTNQRFRLVGVGLSNFREQTDAKPPMFDEKAVGA